LIDEFRSAPNRLGTGINERAVPLNMDGSPFTVIIEEKAEKKPASGPAAATPTANGGAASSGGSSSGGSSSGGSSSGGSKEDDALSKAKKK
jgi:uncharacterized membrane protein YgcG